MKKRGISPIIATILIISFTILLGAFVMIWGGDLFKNYQQKTGEESKVNLACAETFFNVKTACFLGGKLNLYIENTGQQDISDFLYRFKGKEVKPEYLGKSLSLYSTLLMSSSISESKDLLNEIELYPNITIDGKSYTCEQPIKKELKDCISLLGLKNADDFMINEGEGWTMVKEDCSTTEKVCVNILTKDNINELKSELGGVSFQTDLHLCDSLIIYHTNKNSYSAAIKSIPLQRTDNSEATHIGLYGETKNMNVIYSIINDNGNVIKFVSTSSKYTDSFTYREPISNDRIGTNTRLQIDVNGEGIGYATIFRFCYTDENGICLSSQNC